MCMTWIRIHFFYKADSRIRTRIKIRIRIKIKWILSSKHCIISNSKTLPKLFILVITCAEIQFILVLQDIKRIQLFNKVSKTNMFS